MKVLKNQEIGENTVKSLSQIRKTVVAKIKLESLSNNIPVVKLVRKGDRLVLNSLSFNTRLENTLCNREETRSYTT